MKVAPEPTLLTLLVSRRSREGKKFEPTPTFRLSRRIDPGFSTLSRRNSLSAYFVVTVTTAVTGWPSTRIGW